MKAQGQFGLVVCIALFSACGYVIDEVDASSGRDLAVPERSVGLCESRMAEAAVGACMAGFNSEQKSALVVTIQKWSEAQGEWPPQLLQTRRNVERYGLTSEEANCLKMKLCQEAE